eukprot:m.113825 g.113825  ORF g.113825 m.113825 type:complete len:89 (+) comp16265_c0_seq1:356-622(+)
MVFYNIGCGKKMTTAVLPAIAALVGVRCCLVFVDFVVSCVWCLVFVVWRLVALFVLLFVDVAAVVVLSFSLIHSVVSYLKALLQKIHP